MKDKNIDIKTVQSFGDEWQKHDQSNISDSELKKIFEKYFSLVDWSKLPENSEAFDMGCGSGRWARFASQYVGTLNCIDPSNAIKVAEKNLEGIKNINFIKGAVADCGIKESSQDFGYSLGVLHHIPNTEEALKVCTNYLKPGAPFLIYLYYNFENRGILFRLIWKISNLLRIVISRFHPVMKNFTTTLIAIVIYYPLSRLAKLLEFCEIPFSWLPLSFYRNSSFKTLKTDSRDRFGTPLEQRFSKQEIAAMMHKAGLEKIAFYEGEPFWISIGYKKP